MYGDLNNTNITKIINDKIYEIDRSFFFYVYLSYYVIFTVAPIIVYWIMTSCCFSTPKENTSNENKLKEKIIALVEIQTKDHKKHKKDKKEKEDNESKKEELIKIEDKDEKKDIIKHLNTVKEEEKNKNKNKNSYTICKFCGFFYYSATTNKKEEYPCLKKFLFGVKDFFVLICNSFLDCCDKTLCNVLNTIFCGEEDICKCNCGCCGCDKINYNKISENFCFCYKEKRKYKWFHDYITSQVQKDIVPYVLEYCLLGLIIIAFDKKFIDFKVKIKKDAKTFFDDGFSSEDYWNNLNDFKKWIIILITCYFFFEVSGKYGKKKLNFYESLKLQNFGYNLSFSILNGIHIMLFVNSIISVIFSILYFCGIKDLNDFILIPVLITQMFYFSLNYFCLCISEQENNNEFLISGSILITIYVKIWSFIYSTIKDNIESEEFIFAFQLALACIIIIVFLYYLFISKSKFKYIICNNCMNCNICGLCKSFCPYLSYNIYCQEGVQYCDCCCCDSDCCCYCAQCQSCYKCVCCKKLSNDK